MNPQEEMVKRRAKEQVRRRTRDVFEAWMKGPSGMTLLLRRRRFETTAAEPPGISHQGQTTETAIPH